MYRPAIFKRHAILLAGFWLMLLAATGFAQTSEPILTTRLDLVSTPTLGGQGTVLWCGVADRPIEGALLTLAADGGTVKGAAKMVPTKLSFVESKIQDARLDFATPGPGRYKLTARVDWQDGEGAKSHSDTLIVVVGKDGKVSFAPNLMSFSINNGATVTNNRMVTLNNTVVSDPPAVQYRASELATLADAAWQTYLAAPKFTLSATEGVKTVYFQVKDKGGEVSEIEQDSIRFGAIAITYPNTTGIEMYKGMAYSITWRNVTTPVVSLFLLKDGVQLRKIAANIPNTGKLVWNVPLDLENSGNYKIGLLVEPGTTLLDTSDNAFWIGARNPQIGYPQFPNEKLFIGERYYVGWAQFLGTAVKVELWQSGNEKPVYVIASSTANSFGGSSLYWTIPSIVKPGTGYFYKISGIGTADIANSRLFNIAIKPKVLYPTATGITLFPGTQATIKWEGFTDATVNVDLMKGTSLTPVKQIGRALRNSPTAGGSCTFTPTTSITPGSDYKIRVTGAGTVGAAETASSINPFTIAGPAKVTNPDAPNLTWNVRGTYTFKWQNYPNTTLNNTVHLEIFRGYSQYATYLVGDVPNTGSYTWTLPETLSLKPETNYRAAVSVPATTSSQGAWDFSDNFFKIADTGTVTWPSYENSQLYGNDSYYITWRNFTINTPVNIDLYKGGTAPANKVLTLATNVPNSNPEGVKSWTVPPATAAGSDYRIRVWQTLPTGVVEDFSNLPFTIETRPVVISPNAVSNYWYWRFNPTIVWKNFTGATVNIDLYRGTGTTPYMNLATGAANNGSYNGWTIPEQLPTDLPYTVKVTAGTTSAVSAPVNVVAMPTVVYPTASGITLYRGDTCTIRWMAYPNTNPMEIDLFKGSTRVQILTTIPDPAAVTSWNWVLPATLATGSDYKIRMFQFVGISTVTNEDWSNYNFAIGVRRKVTYPNDLGVKWNINGTYQIKWEGFSASTVKVELVNGLSAITLAAAAPNGGVSAGGTLNWTVPTTITLGSGYKVRVTETVLRNTYYDYSDNYLAIASSPKVASPSAAGIALIRNKSTQITWSGFSGTDVKIELLKGTINPTVTTVATRTPNDGSFSWTPTAAFGTDYKIRITSLSLGTDTDVSDYMFGIADPKVTAPNTSISVARGAKLHITWSGFVTPNVTIRLYAGTTLNRTIIASTPNEAGFFDWVIPSTQTTGSNYAIVVMSTTDALMADASDATFRIY